MTNLIRLILSLSLIKVTTLDNPRRMKITNRKVDVKTRLSLRIASRAKTEKDKTSVDKTLREPTRQLNNRASGLYIGE